MGLDESTLILLGISVLLLSMQVSPLNSILQALLQSMDHMPKNSLPIQTNGTVQQNFGTIPAPTLYNAHGIVTPQSPNTLIAKV